MSIFDELLDAHSSGKTKKRKKRVKKEKTEPIEEPKPVEEEIVPIILDDPITDAPTEEQREIIKETAEELRDIIRKTEGATLEEGSTRHFEEDFFEAPVPTFDPGLPITPRINVLEALPENFAKFEKTLLDAAEGDDPLGLGLTDTVKVGLKQLHAYCFKSKGKSRRKGSYHSPLTNFWILVREMVRKAQETH